MFQLIKAKVEKGQTLVEVLVSLAILMIVLVSLVSLITSVLNLNKNSRIRTEATAIAQKAITDVLARYDFGNSCIVSPSLGSTITPAYTPIDGITLNVTYNAISAAERTALVTPGPGDQFKKIISTASWTYRGISDQVVIYQFVR